MTHPLQHPADATRELVTELVVFTLEFVLLGPPRPDSGDAKSRPARRRIPGGKPHMNMMMKLGEDATRTAADNRKTRTRAPHTSSYRYGI